MAKIIIEKSPTTDEMFEKDEVTLKLFEKSTEMHQEDVKNAIDYFIEQLEEAAVYHDWTKNTYSQEFYDSFTKAKREGTKFTKSKWYENHIKQERHHINSYVHDDVDLIDVLEMIADCVVAGLARSNELMPVTIDKDILYKAFENTCKELIANCEVKD